MKNVEKSKNRAEQILLQDKMQTVESYSDVIKSDIYNLLNDYFDIIPKSLSVKVEVDNYGIYSININAKSDRVKRLQITKSC